MNVRERHETQCHVESGVFIVPLIVMVIYIYIYSKIKSYNLYITSTDYSKSMKDKLDESSFNDKIKTLTTKEEIKVLATNEELKAKE